MSERSDEAEELKHRISLERLLEQRYGVIFRHSKARCLFAEQHAHGDQNPSMILSQDGHRVKCLAGDHLKGWADCFQVVQIKESVSFPEAKRICARFVGVNVQPHPARRIIRRFRWEDENGVEAWHLRWEAGEPKFTWAKDADNKAPGMGACKPSLWNLSAVQKASSIILCEGERDTDTVNGWLHELSLDGDIVATTVPNGASDVKPDHFRALAGKERLFVSGDNDPAGQRYREACGTLVYGQGASVLAVHVPEAFNDWTAWAEGGGTAPAFKALLDTATPFHPPNCQPALGEAVVSYADLVRMDLPERKKHMAGSLRERLSWSLVLAGWARRCFTYHWPRR